MKIFRAATLVLLIKAVLIISSLDAKNITVKCVFSNQFLHLNGRGDVAYRTCVLNNISLSDPTDNIIVDLSLNNQSVSDTVGLKIRNSIVKFFPREFFKVFPKLAVIDMDNQKLDVVNQNYFVGASSATRTFWAPNNNLTRLGPNAFSYMGYLYTLYLDNNPVEYIHSLAFSGLPQLSILFLGGSKMKTLSFNSFFHLTKLTSINFLNANNNTNCLNGAFTPPIGNLASVQTAIEANCLPGDPYENFLDDSDQIKINIASCISDKVNLTNQVQFINSSCFTATQNLNVIIDALTLQMTNSSCAANAAKVANLTAEISVLIGKQAVLNAKLSNSSETCAVDTQKIASYVADLENVTESDTNVINAMHNERVAMINQVQKLRLFLGRCTLDK